MAELMGKVPGLGYVRDGAGRPVRGVGATSALALAVALEHIDDEDADIG
jgi:hypothetical protein